MLILYHQPFSPACRFIRLVLAEYGVRHELVLEKHWERRKGFLAMNPAATLPVAVENDGPPVVGAGPIMEYLDETRGYAQGEKRLMPDHPDRRAETRRLVEWFLWKFDEEAVGHFVHERIYKLEMPTAMGGGAPESTILRAARANLRHHMRYMEYLTATRNWLAGDRLTFADLAAAAELSCTDYLGEVPWSDSEHVKTWYARIKSRPAFRSLLAETIRGLPPSPSYDDLDF